MSVEATTSAGQSTEQTDRSSDENEKRGWLKDFLRVRTLEPSRESHSMQLSTKQTVYELQCKLVEC